MYYFSKVIRISGGVVFVFLKSRKNPCGPQVPDAIERLVWYARTLISAKGFILKRRVKGVKVTWFVY